MKKTTSKILRVILVGYHFINSTVQGFYQQNLVIFQEHDRAILNTFSVATWAVSLSLCFREHSLQGGCMKTSLRVFSPSSALQTDQS